VTLKDRSPTPKQIIAARTAAGLSVRAASALIHGSVNAWEEWELGARRMHPGLFELFMRKLKEQSQKPSGDTTGEQHADEISKT